MNSKSRVAAGLFGFWSKLDPFVRAISIFLIFNSIVLTFVLEAATPFRTNYIHIYRFLYDLKYILMGPYHANQHDSWRVMWPALEIATAPANAPLYQTIFFGDQLKFQYPPTSLLFLEPLAAFPYADLTSDAFMNGVSLVMVFAIVGISARILFLANARFGNPLRLEGKASKVLLSLILIGLGFSFYPLVKSYNLGQIQTWITFFFSVALLAWLKDRKEIAGVMIGLICMIKPQLGLLLVWAALRKEWRFLGWLAGAVSVIGAISLWRYGLANHLDYLEVLSFLAARGEAYYPNQSMNGLLNRLFFNGSNLNFMDNSFPELDWRVQIGTSLSTAILIGFAFLWRRREHRNAGLVDLSVACLSFTIASPIAWEHHYGIMLPIFFIALPATAARFGGGLRSFAPLAIAYVLSSQFLEVTNALAETPFNFIQSYLFFAALLLLVHLYRLRSAAGLEPHGAEVRA